MKKLKKTIKSTHFQLFIFLVFLFFLIFFFFPKFFVGGVSYTRNDQVVPVIKKEVKPTLPPLDKVAYDKKLLEIANNPPPKPPTTKIVKDPKTGVETTVTTEPKPILYPWPVKTAYPNAGALLPFSRVIAYYGNLEAKKMGVLGEYPEDEMLARLAVEVKKWEVADPATPVIPALHYIAVVAQGSAGKDGKYRASMSPEKINKVIKMAEKINAIVFLDIQVGLSDLEHEIPLFEKYFKMPNVHLGVDPEFSMKNGVKPGKAVGTLDAEDINFAVEYLAKVVKDNNLPPKILIVHRYTQKMVTNYQLIKPLPEVQFIMHMDGWGGKSKKIGTYKNFVYKEPVQFTGFKLFYKNDVWEPGTVLFSPEELLKLSPIPSYIQFQ